MTENLSDRFSKHRMNSLSELKADTTLTRTKERAVDVLKQKIAEQPNPYETVAKDLVNETLNKTTTLPSSTPVKSTNMPRSSSPETTFDYNNKLGQDRKNTQQTSDLTDKELNHIGNWYAPRPQVPAIRPQAQEAFSESVDYESPAYYRSLNEPDSSNIQKTMASRLPDNTNINAETPSNLHRIEENQYKLPSGYQPVYNSEDRAQKQAQTFSNLLPTSKNFQSQMHIVDLYASPKAGRRSISSHGSIPIPVIYERKLNHPRYEPYEEIDMFRRFRSKAQSPPPPSSPPFVADERFRGSSLPPLGPADSFRSPNVPNKIEHSSFERRPDQSVAQYFKQEQNRDNVVKATREVITFQNEEDPTQYSTMRATVRGGQNPNNVIPKVYTATITYYHHQSENYPNQGLPKPNAMSTPIPSEQRIVIEPPYGESIRDKSRIIDSAAFGNIARPVIVQDEKTFVRRIDNKDDSHLYGSSVDSGYGRWGDQSPPLSPFGANSNESRSPLPVTNYYSNVPTRETVIVDRRGPSPTPPIGAVFIPGPPPRVSSPHQEYLLPAVVTEEKKKHGFFSRGDKDKEPVQKVGYIPVIDGAVQLIPAGRDGKPDIHAIDTSKNNGPPQMVPMPGAFIQGPSQPIPRGQIVQEVREYREILPPQPIRHPSPHSHPVPIGFVSVPMQRYDGDRPRYIEERRIPPPSTASGGFDPNAYHGGWERGQGQPVYLKEAPRDYVPSGGVTLIEDRRDKSLHLLPGYDTRETHSTPIGVAHPTWNRDKEVHFRDSQFRDGPPHDQGKRRTSLKDRFKELVGLDHPHHPAHEEKGDYVLTGVFTDDDKKALKHEEIKSKDDGKTITKTTEVTEHKEEVKTTGPSADQRIRAGISDINEYNRGVSDERLRTLKRDAERISRDADSLKLDAKDLRDDIDNKRIFAEWGMSDQPANASTTAVVNTSSTTTTTRARSNSIKGYIHDEVDHIKNRIMHPFGGGHPHAVAAATAVPAPTERRPSISDRVSEKYHHMKDKVEHYVHDHSHSPPRHDTTAAAAGAVVTEYHPHKKSMSEKISEKFDDMKEKVKEPFTRDDKDRGSYRTESGGVGYYPLPSSQRYYEERPPAVYYEERRFPATQYYPSDRGGASVVPIAVAGGAAGVGAPEAMRRHRSPSIKERITEFFKGPSSTTDKNIPAATSQNVPTYVDYGKPQPSGFTSTSYVSSAPQDYYRLQRSPSVKDKIFDATDEKVFHNRFYDPNDPLYRGPSQLQRKRSFKEKIADSVQNAKEKITGPSTTVNYDKPGRAYYSDNVRVPVYSTVGYVSQPEPTFNESDYYRSPIKREIITSEEVLRVPDTVIIDDSVKSRLPDWKKGEAVQAIPITVVERREYIPDRKNDIPYQSNLRIIDDNRDYYGTQRPVETVEIQRIPAQTNYVSDYKPFPPPATLLLGSKPYYGDDISSGNRLGIGDRSRIQITTNDIRPGPHYVARDIGRSVSPPSYYATKSTSFRSKSYDPARFPRFVVVDKRRGGNGPGDSTYGTDFYKEVLAGKFNDPDSAFPNLKYLPRTTSASSFFGSGGHYTTSGGAGQPPPSYYAVEHHDKKKGDSFNIKDWFTGGIFSDKKSSKKPEVEYEVYDPHAQYATQQLVRETQPIAVESSQQPYIIEETSVQNTLTPHVAQHIPVMTVSQTDHLKHASTVSQSSPHIVNYESNLNNIPSANQQIVFKDFSHNESLVPVPTPSKEQIVLYSDLHKPLISSQADSTVKSTGDVSGPSTSSLKEKEKKTSIFGKKPKKLFNKLKDSLSIDRDDKRNVEASKNKTPTIMGTNILPNSSDKVGSTVIISSQSANTSTIDAIYDPKTGHYKYHDPLNQPYEKIQDGIFHDALFKENGKELTKHLGPNQVEVIPGTELINKMSTIHPTTLYNNLSENASFVHGDGSVITTNVDPNNFIKPDLMSAKWPKQTEATNGGIYEYKDPIGDPYHKIKDPALQDSVFREQAVKHLSTMSLSTTHADRVYTNQYDTTKTISSLQEPISSYKVRNQKSDSNWAIPRNSADIPPEHYLQQGKDGPNHDVSTLGKLEKDKTSTHYSKIKTTMSSLDHVGKSALMSSSMPLNSAKVLNDESSPITTFNIHCRPSDLKVSKDTSPTKISSSHSNKLDATPHPASYKLVPHVKIPENSADIPDHSYDNRITVKEESIKKSVFIPCPCNGPPHPHSAHEHEVSNENQINISKNLTDDDTKSKQPFKPLPSGGIYLPAEKSMQRKNEGDFSNHADINDKWPKTISVLPRDEIKDEYSTQNKRQPNNIERVCQNSPINYNSSTLTSKGNNIQSQGQAISSVNYEKEIPLQNTMDDYEINTGHFNARNSLIVTCAQNSIDINTTIAHTPSDKENNYKSNIVNSIENYEPRSFTKSKPFSGIKNFFGGVGIKREKSPKNVPLANESSPLKNVNKFTRSEVDSPSEISQIVSNTDKLKLLTDNVINRNDIQTDSIKHYPVTYVKDEVKGLPQETLVNKNIKDGMSDAKKSKKKPSITKLFSFKSDKSDKNKNSISNANNVIPYTEPKITEATLIEDKTLSSSHDFDKNLMKYILSPPHSAIDKPIFVQEHQTDNNKIEMKDGSNFENNLMQYIFRDKNDSYSKGYNIDNNSRCERLSSSNIGLLLNYITTPTSSDETGGDMTKYSPSVKNELLKYVLTSATDDDKLNASDNQSKTKTNNNLLNMTIIDTNYNTSTHHTIDTYISAPSSNNHNKQTKKFGDQLQAFLFGTANSTSTKSTMDYNSEHNNNTSYPNLESLPYNNNTITVSPQSSNRNITQIQTNAVGNLGTFNTAIVQPNDSPIPHFENKGEALIFTHHKTDTGYETDGEEFVRSATQQGKSNLENMSSSDSHQNNVHTSPEEPTTSARNGGQVEEKHKADKKGFWLFDYLSLTPTSDTLHPNTSSSLLSNSNILTNSQNLNEDNIVPRKDINLKRTPTDIKSTKLESQQGRIKNSRYLHKNATGNDGDGYLSDSQTYNLKSEDHYGREMKLIERIVMQNKLKLILLCLAFIIFLSIYFTSQDLIL